MCIADVPPRWVTFPICGAVRGTAPPSPAPLPAHNSVPHDEAIDILEGQQYRKAPQRFKRWKMSVADVRHDWLVSSIRQSGECVGVAVILMVPGALFRLRITLGRQTLDSVRHTAGTGAETEE
ncbi:hypothetical protein Bbelb_432520 [Branchiostoma belcheri]|nr:hypothetical protein Bbelb_432520 [Branchiostoma belcheri]